MLVSFFYLLQIKICDIILTNFVKCCCFFLYIYKIIQLLNFKTYLNSDYLKLKELIILVFNYFFLSFAFFSWYWYLLYQISSSYFSLQINFAVVVELWGCFFHNWVLIFQQDVWGLLIWSESAELNDFYTYIWISLL